MLLTQEELNKNLPLNAATLLTARGGEWLGVAHNWIQRKCSNGERVTWGSQDWLTLPSMTVWDMEHLAATIAAAAIAEARKDIDAFVRGLKPSGLDVSQNFGRPMIETKVVTGPNGELDHSHCVGAYSWMTGGLVYGQGIFAAVGTWEHGCVKCNYAHKDD